jgi:hypothetical protein
VPWDTASWEPGPAPNKEVKINHSVGGDSGYTATNPTGVLSRNTFQMSGPTKLTTLLVVIVVTLQPIRLVCCLATPFKCLAQQNTFVSSRQSGQIPTAVRISFEYMCSGQNLSDRTCERYATSS